LLPTAPACVPEGRTVDSTTGGRPTTGVSTIQRICSIGKAPLAAGAVAAVGAMTGPSLQFGVLYVATLRQIGAAFRGHAALFGFDSFTGLPPEQAGKLRPSGWRPGALSTAASGQTVEDAMWRVRRNVGTATRQLRLVVY